MVVVASGGGEARREGESEGVKVLSWGLLADGGVTDANVAKRRKKSCGRMRGRESSGRRKK